ncbi:YHS domain-containing protein [Candidatus Uhrbacteria bacterium]|nr:YHS domain-containing protein [Candidatus Uhrbacteria bacterium]
MTIHRPEEEPTTCRVCLFALPEGTDFSVHYSDRDYRFCSAKCMKEFYDDPVKFLYKPEEAEE